MAKLHNTIIPILRSAGVRKAALFGSVARGTNDEASDIDILVELSEDKSLFDLIGLQQDLEETLHKKVDVVTYNSLHPRIRDRILVEQEILYE